MSESFGAGKPYPARGKKGKKKKMDEKKSVNGKMAKDFGEAMPEPGLKAAMSKKKPPSVAAREMMMTKGMKKMPMGMKKKKKHPVKK